MPFALTPEREKLLLEILERYPNRQAACIPALHLCQQQNGWISQEIVEWLAARLELSAAHVQGVATFYSLLDTEPTGKHQVWVCRTLGCALRGSDRILSHCEKKLGIRCGQTTADGKVTLRSAECLASCGSGPVLQVDRQYHERVTPKDVDAILDRLLGEGDASTSQP
jgi:NADH-quinone oxidoreductase subunit E